MKLKQNKNKKENNIIAQTSLWKILALFIVINLFAINLINYWQPVNHNDVKEQFEQKHEAILSAYDLQNNLNSFKSDPDQNAYSLIQKSVKLNNAVDKYLENNTDTTALNSSIEQIIAKVPSLKLYQQNIEKITRMTKVLKQKVFVNLSDLKTRIVIDDKTDHKLEVSSTDIVLDDISYKIELSRVLLVTIDKIETLIQNLKYDYWISDSLLNKYQINIEDIGLEIEQVNNTIYNYLSNTNIESNNLRSISSSLDELFNELNALMPSILELSEIANKLTLTDQHQQEIINNLKQKPINYINKIDDKTLVILTLILANILLCLLVVLAKATEKTKKVYSNYKAKKEIYYLSYSKDNKSLNKDYEFCNMTKEDYAKSYEKDAKSKTKQQDTEEIS